MKVAPEALTLLARQAFHDASFMLRPAHQQQVADILRDPEASENDKYVALQFLATPTSRRKVFCQPVRIPALRLLLAKKGSVYGPVAVVKRRWRGVYNTYIEDNLRYSQNAPLDMYKEVNTGTNLPAQIDLYAVDGDEYKFLCIAKGGGSGKQSVSLSGNQSVTNAGETEKLPG
ncbi:fumarate hydratase [Escherichia coli]